MASDQEQQTPVNNDSNSKEDRRRRRKRRWATADDAPPSEPAPTAASSTSTSTAPATTSAPLDAKAKALALQASIRAKLAALKADKKVGSTTTAAASATSASSNKRPAQDDATKPSKRAKRFDIDFSATAPTFQKDKDETAGKPKKKVNPYLTVPGDDAGGTEQDGAADGEDERLVRASKPRSRHKVMKFVEPGTFVEIAERKRQKAINAAESGFTSGRKKGEFVTQSNMAQVYGGGGTGGAMEDKSFTDPRFIPERAEHRYDHMPLIMEWWDVELLPSKLKKVIAKQEGKALSQQAQAQLNQLGTNTSKTSKTAVKKEEEDEGKTVDNPVKKDDDIKPMDEQQLQELRAICFDKAALSYSKTAALVQHIVPMKPPHVANNAAAKKPVLHLTKRELKRQRKLRRQEKQTELRDRQAAGLEPPPEPRLTLKNFIRVLGDQAYLDPSQMEQKVMEQIQARQRAHLERNQSNKLTKEQRAAKKTEKLQKDASQGVTKVALFFVQDMSHPYHRAKVDLNAQQNMITGGVLECESPSMACVICEGGPKAIQRFKRLMLVRMKWTGTDDDDEEEEEDDLDDEEADGEEGAKLHKFNKNNRCELVWEGLAIKRVFPNFVFQSCETAAQARKVLKTKGVEHYWDQAMEHASGLKQGFQLKLVDSESENENEDDDDGNDNTKIEAMDES